MAPGCLTSFAPPKTWHRAERHEMWNVEKEEFPININEPQDMNVYHDEHWMNFVKNDCFWHLNSNDKICWKKSIPMNWMNFDGFIWCWMPPPATVFGPSTITAGSESRKRNQPRRLKLRNKTFGLTNCRSWIHSL
jgi:hypothetical protein